MQWETAMKQPRRACPPGAWRTPLYETYERLDSDSLCGFIDPRDLRCLLDASRPRLQSVGSAQSAALSLVPTREQVSMCALFGPVSSFRALTLERLRICLFVFSQVRSKHACCLLSAAIMTQERERMLQMTTKPESLQKSLVDE